MEISETRKRRLPLLRGFLLLGGILVLLFVLVVLAGRILPSIKDIPVYVIVPTNPPPQFVAALGSNVNYVTAVPFTSMVHTPVTQKDLELIKQAIPRSKTVGHFFRPDSINIRSSEEAEVAFWRRRTQLRVTLIKTGEVWRVAHFDRSGHFHWITPPDLADTLEKKLPF